MRLLRPSGQPTGAARLNFGDVMGLCMQRSSPQLIDFLRVVVSHAQRNAVAGRRESMKLGLYIAVALAFVTVRHR